MTNAFMLSSVLLATLLATGAQASAITLETRTITNNSVLPTYQGAPNIDYRAGWQAQSSAINTQSVSAFNNSYSGNSSFSHLAVQFTLGGAGGNLQFQVAPDAGWGGAVYMDGQLLNGNSTDLWWGGNWNSVADVLAGVVDLGAGAHVFEAYWAEGCCNGMSSGRFNLNNTNWLILSVANLDTLPDSTVPLPGVLPLLGLGLIGLGFVRRLRI